MIDPKDMTWVILAGGQATRMHHNDKGLVIFQDQPLVEHVLTRLRQQLPTPILINANRHIEDYAHYGSVIEDIWPGYLGPLAGMHSGLQHAQTPWVGFSPCDSPFLHSQLIARFCQQEDDGVDAFVASDGERVQPAFVVIRRRCLPVLEAYLAAGERRLMGFIRQLSHRHVVFNDEAYAFVNINSLEEIEDYRLISPSSPSLDVC